MLSNCSQDVHGQEEEILRKDRHLGELGAAPAAPSSGARPLNPCPCNIDIEQNEQNAQSQNARVELVVSATKSVEQ